MTMEGQRYDVAPLGTGTNWVTKVGGLPLFVRAIAHALIRDGHPESEAIEVAVGTIKRWAAGEGKVTAKTRAKATAALAEWEAKRVAPHGTRDAETESGTAGSLLPVGPAPRQAAAIVATERHAHRGRNLDRCTACGLPATDPIHASKRASGVRHAGPLHVRVPTGHVAGNPVRHRIAQKQAVAAHMDAIEADLHAALLKIVARQRAGTLSRLRGSRGKRMLRSAQGGQQAGQQPPAYAAPPPAVAPPGAVPGLAPAALGTAGVAASVPVAITLAAIFDIAFWVAQIEDALERPVEQMAAERAQEVIGSQLGPEALAQSSIATAAPILRERVRQTANRITDTTAAQLADALAEGVAAGEGLAQMVARVQHVFDVAESRASTIARTEAVGALNAAAWAYAAHLPLGVVGDKQWLAHHDTRTRLAHRLADGQNVPVNLPFTVGGFLMQYPGDPSAPPELACNCRCGLLFLPAHATAPTGAPALVAA